MPGSAPPRAWARGSFHRTMGSWSRQALPWEYADKRGIFHPLLSPTIRGCWRLLGSVLSWV